MWFCVYNNFMFAKKNPVSSWQIDSLVTKEDDDNCISLVWHWIQFKSHWAYLGDFYSFLTFLVPRTWLWKNHPGPSQTHHCRYSGELPLTSWCWVDSLKLLEIPAAFGRSLSSFQRLGVPCRRLWGCPAGHRAASRCLQVCSQHKGAWWGLQLMHCNNSLLPAAASLPQNSSRDKSQLCGLCVSSTRWAISPPCLILGTRDKSVW